MQACKFHIPPARVFRFEQMQQAHRLMESNQANGKIVVALTEMTRRMRMINARKLQIRGPRLATRAAVAGED
jgi:hypothetical protein